MKKTLVVPIYLMIFILSVNLVYAHGRKQKKEPATLVQQNVETQEESQMPKKPNIGCLSCHKGEFALFNEAKDAQPVHPFKDPSGKKMNEKTTLETCMKCHATNLKDGKGIKAPLAMSSIVHPAHLFSQIFKNELNGTCYSCHIVGPKGFFEVIPGKPEIDDKGIPDKLPLKTLGDPPYIISMFKWVIAGVVTLILTFIISVAALVIAITKKR